jgi:large subunit ribosomal protein L31
MKDGIHPDYHRVIFLDTATGREWESRSTMKASTTKKVDGVEVPVIHLDVSAESHPYWTGQQRSLDTEGRVDRFKKRYAKKKG